MTQVATIVIVAVGMTFVIATGGIDLSVGSLMAIAGVLAPLFLLDAQQFGAPAVGLALAIVAPLIATTLLGAFNGTLVTVVGLQPIIATLVLYLGGRGIAQLLVNGELRELRNLGSPLISNFEFIGLGQVFGIRFQIIIMLVVVVVAAWVLARHDVRPLCAGDRWQSRGGAPGRRAGEPGQDGGLLHQRIPGRARRARRGGHQSLVRSASGRRVHGARRHRGGRGRRHAAHRAGAPRSWAPSSAR